MAALSDGVWDAILELCKYEEDRWDLFPAITGPVCFAEDGGEGEGEGEGAGEGEGSDEGSGSGSGSGEGEGTGSAGEPDWKRESRKHERRAKKTADDLAAANARIAELEQQGATDQEKAVAQARKEAAEEAKAEALAELRSDRLEVAVGRLANGITVKDGDEEKTIRFADPEDALLHVEKAIEKGDIDEDEIYNDEGRVQTDALTSALEDLLRRKPHLQATNGAVPPRGKGDPDAGKGSGGSKSVEDMSVDEHFEQVKRH